MSAKEAEKKTVSNVQSEATASVSIAPSPDAISVAEQTRMRKGWTMVSLVFVANFLVFGYFKSLGMLTKILNNEFKDSTMNVYVLMCITYSLNCGAGPLSCYLTRRFSARTMALVGTSMVTIGLMLSWFAKSLMVLYFSLGILTGIGSGLTYPTGIILVSNYFIGTKNAAIANAMVVSGSPIGGMLMPFFISFLSDLYTSRGAFLILGAVMLHAVLCARAFSPPDPHYETVRTMSPTPESGGTCDTSCQDSANTTSSGSSNVTRQEDKARSCSTGVLRGPGTVVPGAVKPDPVIPANGNVTVSSISVREKPISQSQFPSVCPLTGNGEGGTGGNNNIPEKLSSENVFQLTNRKLGTTNLLANADTLATKNKIHHENLPATGSNPFVLAMDQSCIVLCPSMSDIIIKQRHDRFFESSNSIVEAGNVPAGHDDKNSSNSGLPPGMERCSFISPLRKPLYVFLLFSNTATAIATANLYLMVSRLVDVYETNNDYAKTSFVYLIISFSDLSGRMVGAYLCDKNITTPAVIYAIGLLSAGASSACVVSLRNFVQMCIGIFVYGFSSGLHVGIYGLLLTNIVGIKRIHAGYGISMLVNGSVQFFAILLIGEIISKYTNCFSWLVPALGCTLFTGGLIWIFGLCLVTLIKKRKNT